MEKGKEGRQTMNVTNEEGVCASVADTSWFLVHLDNLLFVDDAERHVLSA
jgi:hypothetical protein